MDRAATSSVSPLQTRAAAVGLAVGFALFVWFVVVMPAAVDFAVGAIVAISWCTWLERETTKPNR